MKMKNWLKRRWFYNFTKLGIKIYSDYWRLNKFPRPASSAWRIAHDINIDESEQNKYCFLLKKCFEK